MRSLMFAPCMLRIFSENQGTNFITQECYFLLILEMQLCSLVSFFWKKYFANLRNNCKILIGGTTIHSAFDFKFGNEITYSSDKKLAELRENLSQLKLIIIDEMSLVGADILYKIDAKLREIFNLRKDIPFAGIGIILVGDLLQIPPVNAKYIFSRPANDKNIITHDITQHESEYYNIEFYRMQN